MQSYDVAEWGQPLQKRLRDTPQPGPDEVLVQAHATAACAIPTCTSARAGSTWAAATS